MENQEGSAELLQTVVITEEQQPSYLIHRIPENQQLIASELLQNHNGLVVDIGGGDFIPVNYASEDLLSQELTEEDRNLAEALVAVQLSQQQKHQLQETIPIVSGTSLGGKLLQEQVVITNKNSGIGSGYLQLVGTDNIYVEKESEKPDGKLIQQQFVAVPAFQQNKSDKKHLNQQLDVKQESEVIVAKTEQVEETVDNEKNDSRSAKKSLPHKKRITKKLKRGCATQKKFKCSTCDEVFTNHDEFEQHEEACPNNSVQSQNNPFSCQLCKTGFADQLQFFEHLKSHYEPSASATASVKTDPEDTPPQVELEAPLKEEQDTNPKDILSNLLNLTCVVCNKTFRKQKTYDNHMKEVHEKYELNEFSEPEDLMEGIDVMVNQNQEESDNEMDSKAWYQEEDLQQTEEDLKEIEKEDHICHICKQPFPLRAILLQHLISCRTITGNTEPTAPTIVRKKNKKAKTTKVQCNLCERSFTHRNSLQYHLNSHHTRVRPHQCETCGKSFFASSALKIHRRLHSGEKPYRCEECGKNFRQWGDLKYHTTSLHSTEKQFQCEYCGKEFARKYSLVVHRRIHTGERNYKCEFCGKCFRASSYLQNHRRIHTGEKPHECDICGKPFRVRSDMKRHQKSHQKKPVKKLYKLQHKEKEENDNGSNDTTELHIQDVDHETEILYEDPLSGAPRDAGMYTNGHQLFLVTYSGGDVKMDQATAWIPSNS